MKTQQLINQVTQQLQQASTACPTPAGPTTPDDRATIAADEQQINAINQIFELFRFNYHNQFLKAFPDLNTLNMAKRLWLRLLNEYQPATLLAAAERTVKECQFLPNVHDVVQRCDRSSVLGLASAHAAYMEACRAPSPKRNYSWSHPAVYYAGLATDWHFLSSEPEAVVFPVFERNYQLLLQRLEQGEDLALDLPVAIPQELLSPLKPEEQKQRLQDLLQQFK